MTILQTALDQLRSTIIANMERAGQVATGSTRDAITTSANSTHGTLEAPAYLATLETGRAPARGGGNGKAFVENLRAWIIAKGIPYRDEDDLLRLARFFRWYINKFGTKLYRSGGRHDIITPAVDEFLQTLEQQLVEDSIQHLTLPVS